MRTFLLVAAAAIGTLAIGVSTASAHGCHREAEAGKHGWHRHAGPYCERVDVPPPYVEGRRHHHEPPPPRCREECVGVGPLRFCEKKCH